MNFKANVSELLRLSHMIEKSSEDILVRAKRMMEFVSIVKDSWDDSASKTYTDKYKTFLIQLSNLADEYRKISFIIERTVDDYEQCDGNTQFMIKSGSPKIDGIETGVLLPNKKRTIKHDIYNDEIYEVSNDGPMIKIQDRYENVYKDHGQVKKVTNKDSVNNAKYASYVDKNHYDDAELYTEVEDSFDNAGSYTDIEDTFEDEDGGYTEVSDTFKDFNNDNSISEIKDTYVDKVDEYDDYSMLNSDDDVKWNFGTLSSGDIEWEVD